MVQCLAVLLHSCQLETSLKCASSAADACLMHRHQHASEGDGILRAACKIVMTVLIYSYAGLLFNEVFRGYQLWKFCMGRMIWSLYDENFGLDTCR